MKFCADSGGGDELERQFAALTVSRGGASQTLKLASSNHTSPVANLTSGSSSSTKNANVAAHATTVPRSSTTPTQQQEQQSPSPELQLILSAMRKLREAIVASHRTDAFAQRAYVFLIRAALLARAWEAYHPALLYLLGTVHPRTPLPPPELREFAGYRVLDLACRVGDLAEARSELVRWRARTYGGLTSLEGSGNADDGRVGAVLRALVFDDWVAFWRLRRAVDGYQRRLMEWAEDGMRLHALKCLGRSYLTADRRYVEKCAGSEWSALVGMGVGWELQEDGETIVIRRPKQKAPGPIASNG
ncbi:MAG: hypothetical protein INR71_12085 [Terriglobus roseus]|nr:hypothetical protein [Terriglobus roseus]